MKKVMEDIIAIVLVVVLTFPFILMPFFAKGEVKPELKTEKDYVTKYCRGYLGGYIPNNGTIPDCIWGDYAVEYDWASFKWYECLTQAKWYAMHLGKRAGCVLIQREESDIIYINRARKLIMHYDEPITLWVLKDGQFKEATK